MKVVIINIAVLNYRKAIQNILELKCRAKYKAIRIAD